MQQCANANFHTCRMSADAFWGEKRGQDMANTTRNGHPNSPEAQELQPDTADAARSRDLVPDRRSSAILVVARACGRTWRGRPLSVSLSVLLRKAPVVLFIDRAETCCNIGNGHVGNSMWCSLEVDRGVAKVRPQPREGGPLRQLASEMILPTLGPGGNVKRIPNRTRLVMRILRAPIDSPTGSAPGSTAPAAAVGADLPSPAGDGTLRTSVRLRSHLVTVGVPDPSLRNISGIRRSDSPTFPQDLRTPTNEMGPIRLCASAERAPALESPTHVALDGGVDAVRLNHPKHVGINWISLHQARHGGLLSATPQALPGGSLVGIPLPTGGFDRLRHMMGRTRYLFPRNRRSSAEPPRGAASPLGLTSVSPSCVQLDFPPARQNPSYVLPALPMPSPMYLLTHKSKWYAPLSWCIYIR